MTDHVEIERTFTTDPRRLFRAWTDPVELAAWFAPTGWTVPAETVAGATGNTVYEKAVLQVRETTQAVDVRPFTATTMTAGVPS